MFAMQQKLHLHELLRQGCNNCKELGNTLNERKPSHEELHVQEIIYKCIVEKFDVIKVMFDMNTLNDLVQLGKVLLDEQTSF